MSKRADGKFPPMPRDLYRTPVRAADPLLRLLSPGVRFIDPCAGDGRLTQYLVDHGHVCIDAYDLKPMKPLKQRFGEPHFPVSRANLFREHQGLLAISNPPYSVLARVLEHVREAWWLLPLDWASNENAVPFLKRCSTIVAVGRVSWMNNGKGGFDNSCWCRFHDQAVPRTEFINERGLPGRVTLTGDKEGRIKAGRGAKRAR